jgi:hypothetical protein
MLAAPVLQQHRLMGAHEKYLLAVIDVDKKLWSHATHGHISSNINQCIFTLKSRTRLEQRGNRGQKPKSLLVLCLSFV